MSNEEIKDKSRGMLSRYIIIFYYKLILTTTCRD